MKKRLIGPHNVDEFINSQDKTIRVQPDMILSPGAKDAIRNKGISICYGSAPCTDPAESKTTDNVSDISGPARDSADSDGDIVKQIITLLGRDYQVTDPAKLQEISIKVMQKIKQENNN